MSTKTKPLYKDGQKVNLAFYLEKIFEIKGEPFWNGFTWMYSFVSEDIVCGEIYISLIKNKSCDLFTPGEWYIGEGKYIRSHIPDTDSFWDGIVGTYHGEGDAKLIVNAPALYYLLRATCKDIEEWISQTHMGYMKNQLIDRNIRIIELLQKINPNNK